MSDFYVGFRTDNPPALRRFTRKVVLAAGLLLLAIAVAVPLLMSPFDPGVFEFGNERTVQGILRLEPQPRLELSQSVESTLAANHRYEQLLLVGFGKFGADIDPLLDGSSVQARGTLIAREEIGMLELAGALEPLGAQSERALSPPKPPSDSRSVALVGEIVDSKCFLGVMKPGRGKTHRSCAALCLAGGVPPAFLVRDDDGTDWVALLLDEKGAPPTWDLSDSVGEPVRIQGVLVEAEGETPQLLAAEENVVPVRTL